MTRRPKENVLISILLVMAMFFAVVYLLTRSGT